MWSRAAATGRSGESCAVLAEAPLVEQLVDEAVEPGRVDAELLADLAHRDPRPVGDEPQDVVLALAGACVLRTGSRRARGTRLGLARARAGARRRACGRRPRGDARRPLGRARLGVAAARGRGRLCLAVGRLLARCVGEAEAFGELAQLVVFAHERLELAQSV